MVDSVDSDCDFGCKDIPDTSCSADNLALARSKCATLKTLFASCRSAMLLQGIVFDDYISGCEYDACNSNPADMDKLICAAALDISTECQESFNITITWRSATFCSKRLSYL